MKRILSIVVSLIILALIYSKIDFHKMGPILASSDPLWIFLSLGMTVPLCLISAWRLELLMPPNSSLGFAESNRLILVASTLNLILPSKMGDISKAFFMRKHAQLSGSLSLSMVVFEKACDMLSLLVWCTFGLMMYPTKDKVFWTMTAIILGSLVIGLLLLSSLRIAEFSFALAERFAPAKIKAKVSKLGASWGEMHGYFWSNKKRLIMITFISIFLWYLHLLQIWMFSKVIHENVPVITNLALAPLAILAGLIPVPTFGGAGTRDAALIVLYGPYMTQSAAACLGIFCTMRYLLPAIGGLPFIGAYMGQLAEFKKSKEAQAAADSAPAS